MLHVIFFFSFPPEKGESHPKKTLLQKPRIQISSFSMRGGAEGGSLGVRGT